MAKWVCTVCGYVYEGEQREVIEEAFEAQSAAEAEYATESYFCGIADCIRFLKYIEGTRSK